ncbi:MAG: class I SAM-dependent methyltransferase [Gammaproteobacteria bacterium]
MSQPPPRTQESAAVAVAAASADLADRARALAARLGLALQTPGAGPGTLLLELVPAPQPPGCRLQLRATGPGAPGAVYAEFVHGAAGHRHRAGEGAGQPLARAVGVRGGARPSVVDATAGLGRDAFVLAGLGCEVRLVERSPVVAALLENALARAQADPRTAPVVARMALAPGDAITLLQDLARHQRPAVVYLDPMYPHRSKSALVKKEMRLFRRLVGGDEDAPALLSAALACARQRVVVKRPRGAAAIAGPAPTMVINGKNTRYDVYVAAARRGAAGRA